MHSCKVLTNLDIECATAEVDVSACIPPISKELLRVLQRSTLLDSDTSLVTVGALTSLLDASLAALNKPPGLS